MAPNRQPLAEFSDRLLAWLIDAGILTGVMLVFIVPAMIAIFAIMADSMPEYSGTGPVTYNSGEVFLKVLGIEALLLPILLAVRYVYDVQMMYRTGQTVGKRVMKIRVVPVSPEATLNRRAATKRWLVVSVAPVVIPFLGYVDGLWQLWDKPYRQCLHDKFADTVVVKVTG